MLINVKYPPNLTACPNHISEVIKMFAIMMTKETTLFVCVCLS